MHIRFINAPNGKLERKKLETIQNKSDSINITHFAGLATDLMALCHDKFLGYPF
jgi:hypothetical protein